MGILGKFEYTETSIQEGLRSFMSSPKFFLRNMYVFGWESDVLILTNSGYWYEIEIKISRADFHNDQKHKSQKFNFMADEDTRNKPNYFYYAVPEGMISPDEVPSFAGLIYMHRSRPEVIKKAPKIHKEKIREDGLGLADKFYHHMVKAKTECARAREEVRDLYKPFRKGYKMGVMSAVDVALQKFRLLCPYHKEIDQVKFFCEKQQKQFRFFCHGECGLLDKLQDEMEKSLKIGAYVEQK